MARAGGTGRRRPRTQDAVTGRTPRQRGLTLVEFIITLLVAGVLLGVAVPGFQKLISAQRLRAASFNLVSDLVLARSEAVKRRVAVQLVPSASGWEGGWTVQFAGGTLDWLTPFSLFTGCALVVGYALLGATWLVMKTDGDVEARSRRLGVGGGSGCRRPSTRRVSGLHTIRSSSSWRSSPIPARG